MSQDIKQVIIPLVDMDVNQEGIIKTLEGGPGFQARLQNLNIRIGKRIKKISTTPFRGPVVLEVDRARVAIGHGMAKKVMVKIIDQKPCS